jgi:hypothetical protein
MPLTDYQLEPLVEAAAFMVEHVYNQHNFKGVADGNAAHYYRLIAKAEDPEQIKKALAEFIDCYVEQNEGSIEGELISNAQPLTHDTADTEELTHDQHRKPE